MPDLIETFADGVATLTMNRPEARNALSAEMMAALQEAIPRLGQDPKVRALVLTGAGDAFCAGGDVKGFARVSSGSPGPRERPSLHQRVLGLRASTEMIRWLHEMPKPTLAAIPGPAAGGGLSFALACDLRIAVETAFLTTAFAKIGLSGDYGGTYFLPHLVGAAKARELYFLSDRIPAREALRLGLVNEVFTTDDYDAGVATYARRLAELPTAAIGHMKKNLNAAERGSLSEVLDLEATHMTLSFDSDDHHRSAAAFVQKEPPVFRGR
ncbi:MAG: enoyl-CoA hydratase [Gammaproteobacteria bacterium]|nr:enoyl-CoA hydratase [Gammaproteobacteria bacterium]